MAIIAKYWMNWNANALVWTNGSATNVWWVDWKSNLAGSFNGSYVDTNENIITSSDAIFTYNILAKVWTTWTYRRLWGNYIGDWVWYYIQIAPNNLLMMDVYWWASNNFNRYTTSTYTDTIKYHLFSIVKHEARDFKIYVDWVEQASNCVNVWSSNFNTTWNWYIWSIPGSWTTYSWNWQIDETEIHNNALSTAELKNKILFYNWFI